MTNLNLTYLPRIERCTKCRRRPRRPGQRWCKICHAAYMRANRPDHSQLTPLQRKKANARAYATTNQRRGKLTAQPCEVPDCERKSEKHHDDYDKPMQVRWLCRKHHVALHRSIP